MAQEVGFRAALMAGWQVLHHGGTALDAVCAAIGVLEDDPTFNAGRGSCLTSVGTVEMDATVMDGRGLQAGAVAIVSGVPHPVHLARTIMEDARHVMLAGAAAERFARDHGVTTCDPHTLITPEQRRRWEHRQHNVAGNTVGAAAVDRHGHLAAATSTGGMSGKLPGRIGDSALIGAGTSADDALGAASATGVGEAIIRVVLAKAVVDRLRDGTDPALAAADGIRLLQQRVGGAGGIVVVDPFGRFGHRHNTAAMVLGYMRPDLGAGVVQVGAAPAARIPGSAQA